MVSFKESYSLFCCFPNIPSTWYGDEFQDTGNNQTSLGLGTFKWLVGIRSSHLVYPSGYECYLEPYLPSSFARQFGYDQMCVGNPHPRLGYTGSLIDGARAWRQICYSWMYGGSLLFAAPNSQPPHQSGILPMVPDLECTCILIQNQFYWNKMDCGLFEGKWNRATARETCLSTETC